MKIPWVCSNCDHENMVDLEHLQEWQVDDLMTAQGFTCEKCGEKNIVSATSRSMRDAETKLFRYPPTHPQFQFLFAKILKKASGMLNKVREI